MDLSIYPPIIVSLNSFFQCFHLCYRWRACENVEFNHQRQECSLILTSSRSVEHLSSSGIYVMNNRSEEIINRILHSENSCSKEPCLFHEICSLIDAGRKHICISPEVYCGIPLIAGGGIQISVNGLSQAKAMVVCKEGHDYTGGSSKIVCEKNGRWSKLDGKCEKVDCGRPSNVENGSYRFNDTMFGSSAYLSCNKGFEKKGVVTNITCTKNGRWSETLGPCIPIDCGEPPTQQYHRFIFQSTLYGSSAEIKCNTGYSWNGNAPEIVCKEEGIWSTANGQCYKDCSEPVASKYFRVNQYHGFVAAFVDFNDESLSECMSEIIEWPTKEPCHVMNCQSPITFSTTYSLKYLSTICVICNGQRSITTVWYRLQCDDNGTWRTKSSRCADKCPSNNKWMGWVDRDSPGSSGDHETVSDIRRDYPEKFCTNPRAIQGSLTGISENSNDILKSFDTVNGLVCLNTNQQSISCSNYKIRFCCPILSAL